MMSHEIRTPLNGLIGLNYLMQSNMQDEEKMQEYLDKSAATGQYLLSLINDILDMSKLQAGKMELYEQPFSIKYMISTIESIMRGRMEDKRIDFTIEQEIIEDIVIGDETRIEQILMNILGNAVKFVDEQGHVLLRVKQTRVDKTSVQTVYEVTDDGCGITEEFQNHIFDSFAQERNKIGSDKKGTGLGMAISSLLVQQMKGTLTVKSRLEEGSVFTLTLVSEVSEAKPDTVIVTETAEHEPYVEHKLHILLAEDQDLNAEILMELLEEKGFLVERAADGVEVVDMFAQSEPNTYDLILMDVQMPNRNGYEATKMIRELQREDARSVLIYACTANAFREDRDMALQSGMDDFISKPIHVEKLMSKLKVKFSGGGIIENAEI